MKKEVMEKWVAALRSGDYQQGTFALNKDNQFCCMGVLCDLAIKDGVNVKATKNGNFIAYDGCRGGLPEKVQEWAKMDTNFNGKYIDSLYYLNDNGKSFEEIADIIEKNYKYL